MKQVSKASLYRREEGKEITVPLAGALEPKSSSIFDNLKGWMSPQEISEVFGLSIHTVYSWKSKAKTRKIPEGLFVTFNRKLYVKTDVLRSWISSQNPDGV